MLNVARQQTLDDCAGLAQALTFRRNSVVRITASPPQPVSAVISAGALGLVIDELGPILEVADYFETARSEDGIEVTVHGVGASETAMARSLVEPIFGTEPELADWTWSLADEGNEDPEGVSSVPDAGGDGATDALSGDSEAPQPDVVEPLSHLLRMDANMRRSAAQFGAFDLAEVFEYWVELQGDQTRADLERLAGLLVAAAVVIQDLLFDDITMLQEDPEDIELVWAFDLLPERFRHRYTVGFLRCFTVMAISMIDRIQNGWAQPRCVAEELSIRLWLDQAEEMTVDSGLPLPPDWRTMLEDHLFEDPDHEYLYDFAYDGFEEESDFLGLGMAPMRFDDWFKPFRTTDRLPIYIQDFSSD